MNYLYNHNIEDIHDPPFIEKIIGRRPILKGRELDFSSIIYNIIENKYASILATYQNPDFRDNFEYLIKWKHTGYIHSCFIYSDMIEADGTSGKNKYNVY